MRVADNARMPIELAVIPHLRAVSPAGQVELVTNEAHFRRVVLEGMLKARVSLDVMTADFKAMLVPEARTWRAPSIVEHFRKLARAGVEIRMLHAGTPSAAAM